jgi:two-component system sensor histidine kinase QseC
MSLRQRLVLLFFGGTLLVWVPVNFLLYKKALAEVDALWDTHLAQSARVFLAFASASAERGKLEQLQDLLPRFIPASLPPPHQFPGHAGADANHYRRSVAFQLYSRDGTALLRSTEAPDEPLAHGVPGFTYRVIDGIAWRVFGIADPNHGLILYAAEDHAVRKDLAWRLVEHLIFPSLLAIPPLLLLIWFAAAKGLSPLTKLVKQIGRRDPMDLRPLAGGRVPVEVEPLVAALNSLLVRLGRALDSERQFTGNAAHELRTPLAALRVQAQVAQRATSDERRQRALSQIIAGADQAAHLLEQLLTLARLDSRNTSLSTGPVKLYDVACRVAADLEPLAQAHRVSVQVGGDENAVSPGDDTCLGILMRNLIDNAIRYAGSGGAVSVTVRHSGLFNGVQVSDTGPGIADGQQGEMFRRFRRGGDTATPGSGLGLSIVRRICELHGGDVEMQNQDRGGLCCEVWLPAFAATPQATASARTVPSPSESLGDGSSSTPQATPSI